MFGIHRILLCWWARDTRALPPVAAFPKTIDNLPTVLIQLPMFNEKFVAERVIRSAVLMDYPRDKLHVQVLDDSTDDSRTATHRLVNDLKEQGYSISLIHRTKRSGYKAGALAHGLTKSSAEFVAIFDADFIPQPTFLKETVPFLLAEPRLGMVQARWGHLNRQSNLLTRAQAIFLDGHFSVEHRGRNQAQRCFNFNGTAGVWRRQAIEEAGGWRSVTITEDFDLSYRAQLKGWKFRYLDDVVVPAELPESYRAFRSQQARWARGSMQSCRLLLSDVLGASQWSLSRRIEALIHLSSNLSYLLMAGLGLLLPLTIWTRDQIGWRVPGGEILLSLLDLTMLTSGTCALFIFYARGTSRHETHSWRHWVIDIPLALCVGAGLCLGNAMEVLRGLTTTDSEFVRTPKQGSKIAASNSEGYKAKTNQWLPWLEGVFIAYFSYGVFYAVTRSLWSAIPFLLLYLLGFLIMNLGTLAESEFWNRDLRLSQTAPPRTEHS